MTRTRPADRLPRKTAGRCVRSWLREDLLAAVNRLKEVSFAFGLPLSVLALAWTLRLPAVSSAIVGASRPQQIEENVKASGIALSDEQWERVNAILAR